MDGQQCISSAALRVIDTLDFLYLSRKLTFLLFFFSRLLEQGPETLRALKADERAPRSVVLEGEAFSHCFIRHYLNLATCGNFWGKLKRGDYVGGTQGN